MIAPFIEKVKVVVVRGLSTQEFVPTEENGQSSGRNVIVYSI